MFRPEKAGNRMRDLTNARAIWTKGVLFLLLGIGSAVLLLLEVPSPKAAVLLSIAIWGFCRAYYFAFYVIEKYVDPEYRFSGLGSFIRYCLRRRAKENNVRCRDDAMGDTTFQDWKMTTDILFQDVLLAADGVDARGDGFARRSYVRAVFAAVEGSTYGLKRLVLHLSSHVRCNLSDDDRGRLSETTTDKQGVSKKRFLPFADNIKFVFDVFAKVHGFTAPVDYSLKPWQSLLAAAKIRDRLMHPKSGAELDVSGEDMAMIKEGAHWYFTTRDGLVERAVSERQKAI